MDVTRLFPIDLDTCEAKNDANICCPSEIESLFNYKYMCVNETKIPEKTYILHLSGNEDVGKPLIALGLADYSCSVYDLMQMKKICNLSGHTGAISGIKFNSQNGNLLYSSSCDGSVRLWDIRSGNKCVRSYQEADEAHEKSKPIISFDVTLDDRLICAGTELIGEDAYILFWDVRSTKLLGGYWESHTDDVTQVKCHPSNNDKIATGSTDGLINIFDIKKHSEEDAFLYCLNTESSVEKIDWLSHEGNDALFCITHTEDLQLWEVTEVAPYAKFTREMIASAMMCKGVEDYYLVDVFRRPKDDTLMLLCGSRSRKRECLRILDIQGGKLSPLSDLNGNTQIVRASYLSHEDGFLVTGGENGVLTVWKPVSEHEEPNLLKLKVDSKLKNHSHRVKQY